MADHFTHISDVPRGRYRTVLADPPWPERGAGECKRGADRHYKLMSISDIAALPVDAIAAPSAHLYCWATNNYLKDAFDVVRAWGFRYITCITWAKDKQGIGQYFRGQTEHILFCVRGESLLKKHEDGSRIGLQGTTLIHAPRGAHSHKPELAYEYMERVSHGPRIEMFGRGLRSGWDLWGNDECRQQPLGLGFANTQPGGCQLIAHGYGKTLSSATGR